MENPSHPGEIAEKNACAFLKKHGLQLVTQNYRGRFGEIDLIMKDKDDIVFVEVRYRHGSDFGSAAETIDHKKRKKIMKTAMQFLQQQNLFDKIGCRFDIVGIDQQQISWIKDAFNINDF